ncbi:single-stranded DNA-binding protein 2 isoform X4 [Triplophysa rosa]|uniref:single-stranded DNA-binding protein 2 isoform X4 n=1 Tax=Triplophysa rosa TaxID=992332 RepID=UPI002545F8A5|nr:single-stranded DNA-binding protein 2 isoform X4 [Triplophysa rosa]
MPMPPGFFQFMSPRYPGGPRGSLRIPSQALGAGNPPLLPSGMDPTRQPGYPNMSGPIQRMTPRGMVPLGPQNYGGGMRPPLNALVGPGMPGMSIGTGCRPWPNPPNLIPYSSASPGSYSCVYRDPQQEVVLQEHPSCPVQQFPSADGPIGSMARSGDIESLPKSSPGNLSMNNQPGTPRDDGEMGGNFLNPFQSDNYSPNMTMSV